MRSLEKALLAMSAFASIAGCAPMPAAISDVSADRVKIVQRITTSDAAVAAEAQRACGMFDRTAIGPMSFRSSSDGYTREVLFICKPRGPGCQEIGGNIVCPE